MNKTTYSKNEQIIKINNDSIKYLPHTDFRTNSIYSNIIKTNNRIN